MEGQTEGLVTEQFFRTWSNLLEQQKRQERRADEFKCSQNKTNNNEYWLLNSQKGIVQTLLQNFLPTCCWSLQWVDQILFRKETCYNRKTWENCQLHYLFLTKETSVCSKRSTTITGVRLSSLVEENSNTKIEEDSYTLTLKPSKRMISVMCTDASLLRQHGYNVFSVFTLTRCFLNVLFEGLVGNSSNASM